MLEVWEAFGAWPSCGTLKYTLAGSWGCVKQSWPLTAPSWKWLSVGQGDSSCMPPRCQMGSGIREGKPQLFRTWQGRAASRQGCVMNQGQTYYLSHLWNQWMETSNKSKQGKKVPWEVSTMSSKMKLSLSSYIHELLRWWKKKVFLIVSHRSTVQTCNPYTIN